MGLACRREKKALPNDDSAPFGLAFFFSDSSRVCRRSDCHYVHYAVSVNRDAIGARLTLTASGVVQRRVVMPTRSYLSQVELPVTFGLGRAPTIESLEIHWPGGDHSVFEPLEPNVFLRIDQEAGVSILARLRD